MEKDWFRGQGEFGFSAEALSDDVLDKLKNLTRQCREDILKMTTIVNSGHPGGSLSSIDIYTLVYSLANLERDRIVVSHGHTSPAVYSILGRLGILDSEEVLSFFRYAGGPYEGHVESHLPDIPWSTGNLGQGLSIGCGFAMASRFKSKDCKIFVLMSDAEQAKGQIAEARRFASKYKLNNLTVVIDYNNRQISGRLEDVMPINIREDYLADGWKVLDVNGHNLEDLYTALHRAVMDDAFHYAILAATEIGKGISFMEGDEVYHGKPLNNEELNRALNELKALNDIDKYIRIRKESEPKTSYCDPIVEALPKLNVGKPIEYTIGDRVGNRDAFGTALTELGKLNPPGSIVALDCDLADSVRVKEFGDNFPEFLIEAGVSEHNTATIAGVISTQGIHTFQADFGVFGIDEVYNQQRLNAINGSKIRLVLTHCGINVGEDGKTHHCIDYLGLVRNLPDFAIIIPADPNQTDRVIRYLPGMDRNVMVVVGRVKEPVIEDSEHKPFFSGNYSYEYGKIDLIREGKDGVILSYGYTLHLALLVCEILKRSDISIAVMNVSSPLVLNKDGIKDIAGYRNIFSYEDHLVGTGLGSIVGNLLALGGITANFYSFGVSGFAPSGSPQDVFKKMGLDPETVAGKIRELIQ